MSDQSVKGASVSYFTHECGASWSLEGDVAEALCPNCNVEVLRRPRRPITDFRVYPFPMTRAEIGLVLDAVASQVQSREPNEYRQLLHRLQNVYRATGELVPRG